MLISQAISGRRRFVFSRAKRRQYRGKTKEKNLGGETIAPLVLFITIVANPRKKRQRSFKA
jgi:hypothetical protein